MGAILFPPRLCLAPSLFGTWENVILILGTVVSVGIPSLSTAFSCALTTQQSLMPEMAFFPISDIFATPNMNDLPINQGQRITCLNLNKEPNIALTKLKVIQYAKESH